MAYLYNYWSNKRKKETIDNEIEEDFKSALTYLATTILSKNNTEFKLKKSYTFYDNTSTHRNTLVECYGLVKDGKTIYFLTKNANDISDMRYIRFCDFSLNEYDNVSHYKIVANIEKDVFYGIMDIITNYYD